ncbi:MAG: Asp-tRNA(Asn)/Glu-tRNA(Gln) amidotransferase subunit GatB [Nitrososphaeraceae archaeon]|nr:Asp-tRNA(Asn)/Glu-tRNA(Gln) amidotransferase subunit GatB [Nitrososphaeraceae archaeon]MDW0144820.1 Asp-tRNA(Asn)/Glu-tRNA(Gln) amidotransferase subunit GatB [Nitrososphaeraceae archaeon]
MSLVMIGLEIHAQITALNSKLFCSCRGNYRDLGPNTNICEICCGLPGSLPVINQKAIEYSAMTSLALGCKVPDKIMFYRKNYFYPDLPKNFQITQYNVYGFSSIGVDGIYELDDAKQIRISRIQLEEDPGRIAYSEGGMNVRNSALIDYNRAGVALIEIVTEPDFTGPKEVRQFLNKLSLTLEHIGVCDTLLEGSVRCDVNVSMEGGNKVEIKNINSFREVEKAINYEITRQSSLYSRNLKIEHETRHWDDRKKITFKSRSKEEEHDYRYFPEPDIPIIVLGNDFVSNLKKRMPELPNQRFERFVSKYNLSEHTSNILINDKKLGDFFEATLKVHFSPTEIANFLITDFKSLIEDDSESTDYLKNLKVKPEHIAELVKLIEGNKISRITAKDILVKIFESGMLPSEVMNNTNSYKIADEKTLMDAVQSVFDKEKSAVEDAKTNSEAINFLLGKVMKFTNGRADPKIAMRIINNKLHNPDK